MQASTVQAFLLHPEYEKNRWVCCWIENQLMSYNCEAGSFSKKIHNNVSGGDCISYSKTGCLRFNPQISNRPNGSFRLF